MNYKTPISRHIVEKLVLNAVITDDELEAMLQSICKDVHWHCDDRCPIYANGMVPSDEQLKRMDGCIYRHNGKEMLEALRNKLRTQP